MSEETKASDQQQEKPLDKMTAKELKEVAREIEGLTGIHAMKKDELLAAVKKAKGIGEVTATPPKKSKKTSSGKKVLSIKDIKKMVAQLREEQAKARGEKKRKEAEILRRRIKRLKRQTKKLAAANA